MSNGRSHRRRLSAAKTRALLDEAEAQAPAVVFGSGKGDGSHVQPVKVGRVLYMVAVPPAGASDRLLSAYSARATASITGQCPACRAARHVRHRGHTGTLAFHHEANCPAGDSNIAAQVRRERAA